MGSYFKELLSAINRPKTDVFIDVNSSSLLILVVDLRESGLLSEMLKGHVRVSEVQKLLIGT